MKSASTIDSITGVVIPRKGFNLVDNENSIEDVANINIPEYFYNRISTGNEVVDGLLNGDGLVQSQVLTVASPRGGGKTTFLMSVLNMIANHNSGLKCLYLSNEECKAQLSYTAQRINVDNIKIGNVRDIDEIVKLMDNFNVIVVDSLPGVTHSTITAPKILEHHVVNSIVRKAKEDNNKDFKCIVFLVMHFTKNGTEAGSKDIYHAVDTCMSITKLDIEEYGENCRMISVEKNRFGSQAEVILKLTREGFDFNAPIENRTQGNDCNKGQNIYLTNKLRDNKALMIRIKEKNSSGGAKIQDFGDLGIDMGRVERLLKDLGSRCKVTKIGGGQGKSKDSIRWYLGDTEPSDFGEEDDA